MPEQGPLTTIAGSVVQHVNAPPLQQNQERAVWGTMLLTASVYWANGFLAAKHLDFRDGVDFYWRALHAPREDSWPYYLWGGLMLFGLLWVWVGMRGSRAPRQIMTAFWSAAFAAAAGYALWDGWYLDDYPTVNWYLRGFYQAVVAGAAMSFWLAVRGTGPGAMRLIRRQIATQVTVFRLGRSRKF
jgi:hypothetical protein